MPEFTTTIETDAFTQAASTAFDYAFDGTSKFIGWNRPEFKEPFGIGLIVGPSGSGKSLLLREFGVEEQLEWKTNKAVVSHFETPDDALNRLMAVGLNSIPSWCKPFHVLSNGEQFRANLARKIKSNAVVDEFTSVVDRNVAKSASVALRRFVDKNNITGLVLASCHTDIVEWLRPDWYFDTTDGTLHDGRLLRRPSIEIRIYPCKRSIWNLFAKHHYLSGKLNPTCRAFVATATFGQNEIIVGFASSITMPSGHLKKAWRGHRTVVLPDFQGLGIGPRISDMIGDIHLSEGKRYFSRTAHPRFGAYRDASPLWKRTSKYRKLRDDAAKRKQIGVGGEWAKNKNYDFDDSRICYSHEYIGNSISWIDEL